MKLELNRLEFLKAWQVAEHSCATKSTVNAATGILITAAGPEGDSDGSAVLEATDFKTSVRCTASGIQVIEPGAAILPVRLLGEFLKKIATDTATLEVNQERGTLIAGKNRTRFTTFPAGEFPEITRSDSADAFCHVSSADLLRGITEGATASSAPADFPKYLGTCLLKSGNGLLKIVSTDSKRLSLSQCPCETAADDELLLPVPALRELARILQGCGAEGPVHILYDGSTAWFRMEGLEFSIRRVESSFPNYEKILTSEVRTTLRGSQKQLLAALDRIDIIARNTVSHLAVMHLSPDTGLKLTTRAPDFGTTLEVLDAMTVTGNPLQVGFNVGFLQDGLRALQPGDVCIEFNGEEGQTRITQDGQDGSGNFLYMLMPTRLSAQDILEDDDGKTEPPAEGAGDEAPFDPDGSASDEPNF